MITEKETHGVFSHKTPFAIAVVVIWNLLFFLDFFNIITNDLSSIPVGSGALTALGLLFLTCLLVLVSKRYRKLVLKEGKELKHIRKRLYFIMITCGLMIFIFYVVSNIQWFDIL
jgi:hypothetical protein